MRKGITLQEWYEAAENQAAAIHADVNQMYDTWSYRVHIAAVADVASKYLKNYPDEDHIAILMGALFHDTIEDARLTYNDVLAYAKKLKLDAREAKIAAEIVYALTNEKGRTRAERANERYYEGIRETPYAPFVKLCDRFANMSYATRAQSSMCKKYRQEWPHFIESITSQGNDSRMSLPDGLIQDVIRLTID